MPRPNLIALAAVVALGAGAAAAQPPNYSTVPPIIPMKTYVVEQLVTPKLPPQLAKQMEPMKTLRQVEELLRANNIGYGWRKAQLNSAALPPAVLKQIEALPAGEVFVLPSGENLTINVIISR